MAGQARQIELKSPLSESKTKRAAQFLNRVPFCLIPGIAHPGSKLQSALGWQAAHAESFSTSPHISVLAKFSSEKTFTQQLASLESQSYSSFTLYVLHLAKDAKEVKKLVSSSEIDLKAISVPDFSNTLSLFREVSSELEGEYLLYLGDNSLLHPFSLFLFARELQDPDLEAIYTNAIQFSNDWKSADSYLSKQGPDAYSLLAKNWYGENFLFSRKILDEVLQSEDLSILTKEGFFWMLASYANAKSSTQDMNSIRHIPLGLLGLMRESQQSIQEDWEQDCQKVLVYLSGIRGVSLSAANVNDGGEKFVTPIGAGGEGQIQVVVPFYNEAAMTIKCIKALEEQSVAEDLFVCLVDNGSSETELNKVREALSDSSLNSKLISIQGYFNFAKLNNIASREGTSPYILFLNNDVTLENNTTIEELRNWCSLDDVGLVGGTLRYPTGSIQHAGIIFAPVRPANVQLREQSAELFREVDGISFAMALTKRAVFELSLIHI